MDRSDDLVRRLMATFAEEAEERLRTLNRDLLALESTEDAIESQRLVEGLFRETHSLKGAARAVNLDRLGGLAHRLESLLQRMREEEVQADPAVCDVMYRALDALGSLARSATADGDPDVDVDLEGLGSLLDTAGA